MGDYKTTLEAAISNKWAIVCDSEKYGLTLMVFKSPNGGLKFMEICQNTGKKTPVKTPAP